MKRATPNVKSADVIVVGSGGAGLMAAMTAADEGAKVLQIEKMGNLGGCWAPGIGNFGTTSGVATIMQFEAGIYHDSPDYFYTDCMRDSRGRLRSNPEILRFYCERAGIIVDWLDRIGAYQQKNRQPRYGIFGEDWSVLRSYFLNNDFGRLILAQHQRRVDRRDIIVLLNTHVTSLILEKGSIVGVKAQDEAGTSKEYRARSVIICTGGFGSNLEMVRTYNLPQAWAVVTVSPPFATGDGFAMCRDVGAQLVNTGYSMVMGPIPGAIPDLQHPGHNVASVNMNHYPAIWVNLYGQRVVKEDCGALTPWVREALESAPEQTLIVLLDHRIVAENPPIISGHKWQWFKERAQEGRLIQQADTIEELGRLVGIDAPALVDTVSKYNQSVAAGIDVEFGRTELKYKIEIPPFYAIKTGVRIVSTSGGPATNVRQQVLDDSGKLIPGLYAAGEVAGYQGYGTGMFNMGCFIFGQQAGMTAAWNALHR